MTRKCTFDTKYAKSAAISAASAKFVAIILKTLHFAQFLCCVNVNDIKSVLSWKIFDPTLTLLININQLIQTVQSNFPPPGTV